jgi:hypothetical protein
MTKTIESATIGGVTYRTGQRVCISGLGADSLIHEHGAVSRFTPTTMVVVYATMVFVYRWRRGTRLSDGERRYRLTNGRQVGGGQYGGTQVAPSCQRR